MKQILKLVFLLVIGQTAFAQAPSNYTNINGRYRWIAGMFDSTFHIPKGSTPSLRTGGSTNSGGLFYNTSDSSVYTYTGTQWIKLRGSINPSDTTNKYVTQVYKKNASDSVFYVKGGNHLFAFIDSVGSPGGGGGGKVYYFNGGVSMGTFGGFAMYELGDTANTGAAANFTRSTTGNIANFITDPGKPGLLQIPAGVWSVDAWLSETGGGANHAEIWVEVEKWDGSTITTIATSPVEQITEGGTPNLYSWSVSIPTTALTVTDRIIIQFYISNTNGKTVTLYTQNGYVGEVHTTFTTGIGAINGLTAPAQYLVTGTSGTDFNINSSTATHTFNLPTASATNRGALSTTDWTTFNNKIGGSLVSGYLTKATGTNTIDTSQIYQSNGKIGIGRTNPTAKVDVYDSLGTGIKSTLRTQINTDVALDVKAVGNRGFALIVDQADSSASGTQYQTLFRKSMMPGTGNPANGGGVSWYTQIGNDNNVYRALSVYRARVIDSTGFANSNIQQTSTEFWTRKAGVWDTTLVLNGGNVGINTGQNGIDSALTVANGTWLKRGVRMSALPTGVGTKALRIDANGTLSVADTLTNGVSGSLTANFIPKATGATTLNNSPLSVGSGVVGLGLGVVPPNSWSNYWALQLANGVSLASYNYADIPIGWLGTNAYHDGIGDIRVSNGAANKYLQDRGNHKWYVAGYGASGSYISWTQPMILDTLNRLTIGVTTPDSMFKVAQGVHLERGVRLSGLPTGVGTKAVRINANGTLSVADTLANGISGTGTTNYIPKFTSSSAIGNSQIFDNGTNVGIGTATPVTKLDVIGNTRLFPSSGDVNLTLRGFASQYINFTEAGIADRGLIGFPIGSGDLVFRMGAYDMTTGSERMRLTSGGSLGIGTSAPAQKLDVVGNGRFNDGRNGGVIFGEFSTSQNRIIGGLDYAGLYYDVDASSSHQFRINGSERMRLDASGNLGIGTTSPNSNLTIQQASTSATLGIRHTASGNGYGWRFATTGTTTNDLIFSNEFNGSFTERMRLDASGNLGLGTSAPITAGAGFSAMTVSGSSGGAYFYQLGSTQLGYTLGLNNEIRIAASQASGVITHYTNGTERMRLDASGNLGLGVTPSAWYNAGNYVALQVGNASLIGRNSANSELYLGANVYVNSSGNATYITSDFATRYIQNDGTHAWFNAPSGTAGSAISFTQAMTLDASGNLLVGGTSSSGERLQITGTGKFTSYVSFNDKGYIRGGTSTLDLQGGSTGTYIYNNSYNAVRMAILDGGNVGIGTTSPDTRTNIVKNALTKSWSADADDILAIENNGTTLVDIRSSNAAAGYVSFSDGDARARGLITYSHASDDMRFNTAGSERMRITSGGELLINTTSDAGDYKLQVAGQIYSNISGAADNNSKFEGNGSFLQIVGRADYATVNIAGTGTNNWELGIRGETTLRLKENGTTRMSILSGGAAEFSSSIKTAAPSGGTAKPWKLGQAGVSVGGANTTAVAVEIDGTVYYLLTAYLPEPEPDPAALPSSGPSASYKPYNKPISVKTTKDVEIENLRKEIEELKQLIKNK